KIYISVFQNYAYTTIIIFDNGIGIFKKIKEYYNYDSLDDAVNELFKGKLTTDSSRHSGEGIFFTSRVLDTFAVLSAGKIFTHNKYSEALADLTEIEILKDWKDAEGTIVLMQLSNYSNKILKEVFDMFSDIDGGFTKTRIPIKNIFESFPVSRSQAKRLCHRFENFEEVELDFSDVDEIGQGFAHEIFVVFQNEHPNVTLTPQNTNPSVSKMISHVKR
ncbi:MAG: STAS-like domain-containing protein, partial [Eubacterium sp.]|nr:STAS-like domain-containing protein [Eubacterium sp.]